MTDTMSARADAAVPEMPETGEIDRLRAALTTGADYWTTPEALGVRSLRLADGPHGLRVQDDENPDHLGLERSAPATCFPPAVTLASSWDPELVEQVGAALGREARGAGVDIVLGPGLNIKRSPLCGRNFEYMSEDPLLAGVMAGAMVNGLQGVGVAACLKHFAANNQETDRLRVSAEIDERTLREIYLRAFQIAVVESTPWSVMSAYNRINGVFASENRWLLTDVLRQEWGSTASSCPTGARCTTRSQPSPRGWTSACPVGRRTHGSRRRSRTVPWTEPLSTLRSNACGSWRTEHGATVATFRRPIWPHTTS